MRKVRVFSSAMAAGALIGIGGIAFLLAENKLIGALLFAVGLFSICAFQLHLFTGKICYALQADIDTMADIPFILAGNYFGTALIALMASCTRYADVLRYYSENLCDIKVADTPVSIFFLAVMCNILIYVAVEGYRCLQGAGKYMAILFGVVVFIMCGFEHSIADMFYFNMAGYSLGTTFPVVFMAIMGNVVGGVAFHNLRQNLYV